MGFIGEAFGAVSAGQKRDADNQMAGIYDKQATTQKQLDDAAAADATSRGAAASGAAAVRSGQTIGAQRVGYSSGGVDTQSGTPLEVMSDTRMLSALDQATIRNNAAREAWGMKAKGLMDYQKGQLSALGGANAASAENMQLIGGSLEAGADVAKSFVSYGNG